MKPLVIRGSRHIVIDARTVRHGATGVGHYVAGLLQGLDQLMDEPGWPAEVKVSAFRLDASAGHGSRWPRKLWASLKNVRTIDVGADYESHPGGDWWLQVSINSVMRKQDGDVLVSPAFIGPAGPRPFKRLLIVPDTIAWELRGNYSFKFETYLRFMTRLAARSADRIASISPSAAARARRLSIGGGGPLAVIPCAIDPSVFRATERPATLPNGDQNEQPLVLYAASLEPRKNHLVLLEAMRRDPLHNIGARLVLLCSAGRRQREELLYEGHGVDMLMHRPSGPAEVARWNQCADVAVFPSRFEGFGIPALEAMACGTPLVASRIDTMHWLSRKESCARLVHPDDAGGWSNAILEAINGGPEVEGRVARGIRRAAGFTWLHSARALMREVGALIS